ncbi:hypothetical protein MCAMS1_00187 [biofilm metagenome]
MKFNALYFSKAAVGLMAVFLTACVITPNDHHNQSGNNNWNNNNRSYSSSNQGINSLSDKAKTACYSRINGGVLVERVSELKPGWHEVVLVDTGHGNRKYVCNVSHDGHISDWYPL